MSIRKSAAMLAWLWMPAKVKRRALFACIVLSCLSMPANAREVSSLQAMVGAEFVRFGVKYCGYERSYLGTIFSAKWGREKESAHTADWEFAEMLWNGTFKCDPAYIGGSCMAARWTLCGRAFEEYGPDGIVIRGLFKPIIHK